MESAPEQKPPVKPLGSLGRDEMNLAEFPITLLTDRVPKDQDEAIYQDEIYDELTGRVLTRKLTIQAGKFGLATAIDDEVILALIQISKQTTNFGSRKVEFYTNDLIKTLGWYDSGASYLRIQKSLDRWTSVYLKYENAWRDNRTKTWKTIGFHIIDKFELNNSRSSDDQSRPHSLVHRLGRGHLRELPGGIPEATRLRPLHGLEQFHRQADVPLSRQAVSP